MPHLILCSLVYKGTLPLFTPLILNMREVSHFGSFLSVLAQEASRDSISTHLRLLEAMLTSHCCFREIPMDPQIIELRLEGYSTAPSDPRWKFLLKSDEWTVFRGAIRSGAITDPETILSTALRLDNDL